MGFFTKGYEFMKGIAVDSITIDHVKIANPGSVSFDLFQQMILVLAAADLLLYGVLSAVCGLALSVANPLKWLDCCRQWRNCALYCCIAVTCAAAKPLSNHKSAISAEAFASRAVCLRPPSRSTCDYVITAYLLLCMRVYIHY